MDKQDNPYAAPETDISSQSAVDEMSEVEQIRHQYLRHEIAVRSVGWIYYLIGILPALAALAGLASIPSGEPSFLVLAVPSGLLAAMLFGLGTGLLRLWPWVKTPVCILSVAALMAIPVGTVAGAYILNLLVTKKGEIVFSAEYREVVRQTPHIKWTTSMSIVVRLILLVAFPVVAFLIAFAMIQMSG